LGWIEVSDAAAAIVDQSSAVAAVHSRNFVTPWRVELANLRDQMVNLIQANADPESQYETAFHVAGDVTHAIKTALRRQYGRTFNSLIDGPEPKNV
jgi:hypothetical protein